MPKLSDKAVKADDSIWEDYWHGDRVALCLDADYQEYSAEVSVGWSDFFSRLDDGSSVLDICTGNGAVPLIAAETARKQGRVLVIHGVDRARIDPKRFLSTASDDLSSIRFAGGIDVSSLPFDDNTFDGLTGQYALEYTDREETLREVDRVLKRRAHIRFLMHAEEGSTVSEAVEELERIARFRNETTLIENARAYIEIRLKVRRLASPGPTLEKKVRRAALRFDKAVKEVSLGQNNNERDFVHSTIGSLQNVVEAIPHYDEPTIVEQFSKITDSIDAHEGRLRMLRDCAVSRDAVKGFGEALALCGFTVDPIETQTLKGRQVGWVLSASRSDR